MNQKDMSVLIKTDHEKAYDRLCKKILCNKTVLAYILKECVEEFRDIELNEISGYINHRYIDSDGRSIVNANTEDETIPGSKIIYDILFEVNSPNDEDMTIIINLEAQKSDYKKYPLLKRAVYYGARLLDRQKNTDEGFMHSRFHEMKKVYTIWICMSHARVKDNAVNAYRIAENQIYGRYKSPRQDYDVLQVVMVYINTVFEYEEEDRSMQKLIHILLGKDLNIREKKRYLTEDYGILITEEEEKEADEMCDLSLGIRLDGIEEGKIMGIEEGLAKGKKESTVLYVKNLMEKMPNLGIQEAMDILGVEENLRDKVMEALK